ncbi:hypothetical protein PUN28_002177 [Cardiocondyla obscurior]|uniref:Uncharacterized protein n=1 Tax=Cardiocondyla obscurior TaxID=286306 RepID=A0AAW2GT33_9HYME
MFIYICFFTTFYFFFFIYFYYFFLHCIKFIMSLLSRGKFNIYVSSSNFALNLKNKNYSDYCGHFCIESLFFKSLFIYLQYYTYFFFICKR